MGVRVGVASNGGVRLCANKAASGEERRRVGVDVCVRVRSPADLGALPVTLTVSRAVSGTLGERVGKEAQPQLRVLQEGKLVPLVLRKERSLLRRGRAEQGRKPRMSVRLGVEVGVLGRVRDRDGVRVREGLGAQRLRLALRGRGAAGATARPKSHPTQPTNMHSPSVC